MANFYTVRTGDTLGAIARSHGITWQDIYNDPANAAFRQKRPDPNVINPGDIVMIPQLGAGHYEVPGMTLVPQPTNSSCWYASAQMLIRWKMNKFRMSLADLVPPEFDVECRRIRDSPIGGLLNPQILPMAMRLGLRAVPPMSPSPQGLERWLRQYGPLWVNGKEHIVVIAGIRGMSVKVFDPWPPNFGKVDWRSLKGWYVSGVNPRGQPDSSRDTGRDVSTVFLYCP